MIHSQYVVGTRPTNGRWVKVLRRLKAHNIGLRNASLILDGCFANTRTYPQRRSLSRLCLGVHAKSGVGQRRLKSLVPHHAGTRLKSTRLLKTHEPAMFSYGSSAFCCRFWRRSDPNRGLVQALASCGWRDRNHLRIRIGTLSDTYLYTSPQPRSCEGEPG